MRPSGMEAGEIHAERREAPAPQDALFPIPNVRVFSGGDRGAVQLGAVLVVGAWIVAGAAWAWAVGALAGTYAGQFT